MSRITKEIATAVAVQLVQPKSDELKQLENNLQETVRKMYLLSLPAGIMDAFAIYKDCFQQCSNVTLSGAGLKLGYKYYKIGDALPKYLQRLELKESDAELVVKIENQVEAKKMEIAELKTAIENALYNYRTYKNVEDNFPEAFRLLPIRKSTVPMIPIKDIRCKLDKANC